MKGPQTIVVAFKNKLENNKSICNQSITINQDMFFLEQHDDYKIIQHQVCPKTDNQNTTLIYLNKPDHVQNCCMFA